jgi:hypothetical protein
LPDPAVPPRLAAGRDILRVVLLTMGLSAGLVPIYRFLGSMVWFRAYLGDFNVFWGISAIPLEHIYDHHVFAYPPTALLLIKPFGLMPFWVSLVAWGLAGTLGLLFALRKIVGHSAIALGFATFAAIGVLAGGQISFFIGALVIAGLTSATPRWRGLLLAAAAVIKPQAVLAAPIALIAGRQWRTIGWAIIVSAGLLLVSLAAFGLAPWVRWVEEMPRFHDYLVAHGIDRMDVGTYGLARSIGLPSWTFLLGMPLGIATSWLVFRLEATPVDRYAAFATSTVLMSPYTLYYDLAGLTFVCVAMLLDRRRSPLIWLASALIVSSAFANLGIILLAAALSAEALQRPD